MVESKITTDSTFDSLGNATQTNSSKSSGHKRKNRVSSFLRAARSGNITKIIQYLTDEKVEHNVSNSNGLTALHLSSKEGHFDVAKYLLDNKCNVNQSTKRGNTSIHIASLAGRLEIVELLIEYGANVNCQAQCGFTPLYMAAQEGHQEIVESLLNKGADQTVCTDDGFTPLAVALQEQRENVVELLLKDDVGGRVKLPALHVAARLNDVKAAALLLQSEYIEEESETDSFNYGNDQNDQKSNTLEKIEKLHTPKLAPHDLMINQTTESGFTALHIAAHYGNRGISTLLLNRGALVDFRARDNITPLHVACKRGHIEVVKLLLKKEADTWLETKDGLTSLHCAARGGHCEVMQLLIEEQVGEVGRSGEMSDEILSDGKSGFIMKKTKNGLSSLHMACQHNRMNAVRLLIEDYRLRLK